MEEHDPAVPCDRVGAGELRPGDPTPGMTRRVALHTEGMWSGTVDTEAGAPPAAGTTTATTTR